VPSLAFAEAANLPEEARIMIQAHTMPVVVLPLPIWQLKTNAASWGALRIAATSWSKSFSSGAASSAMGILWYRTEDGYTSETQHADAVDKLRCSFCVPDTW
jgi:hypothetical protein